MISDTSLLLYWPGHLFIEILMYITQDCDDESSSGCNLTLGVLLMQTVSGYYTHKKMQGKSRAPHALTKVYQTLPDTPGLGNSGQSSETIAP